ncbi:MAG: thioredoxin fold domain-containing protein [Thermodesulfobacteriota bacterium]
MRELNWRKDIKEVSDEISGGTRLPLLFFYRSSGCEGSNKTMGEVICDETVIKAVEREATAIKYDVAKENKLAERYHVDWTPTFILTDEKGNELDRWTGYLPAEDFITQLTLSKGLAAFYLRRYRDAEREFEMLIEEHPDSELVAEAEYFLGVSIFKEKGDALGLVDICHSIEEKYPESQWAKKCSIWSHKTMPTRKPMVNFD